MFRIEWIDMNGDIKTVSRFKKIEEAYDWIKNKNFEKDEFPMVFYDGEYEGE